MRETGVEAARRYSAAIADEVRAVEVLLSCDPDDDGDDIADALRTLELEHCEGDDMVDVVFTYLNETTLDVDYYVTDDDGVREYRTVILRTCGGPRCEITRDSMDGHQIEVTTWELDEVGTYRVTAPAFSAFLDDLAENATAQLARR